MIWLVNRRMRPAGRFAETVVTPHGPARFHDGHVRHWRCLTFVLDALHLSGPTDLGFFLHFLQTTARLPQSSWLASVELGTEICYGQGRAELRNFGLQFAQLAG